MLYNYVFNLKWQYKVCVCFNAISLSKAIHFWDLLFQLINLGNIYKQSIIGSISCNYIKRLPCYCTFDTCR